MSARAHPRLYRRQRTTAFLVLWAFVLVSALASLHAHAPAHSHAGTCYHAAGAVLSAPEADTHTPDHCLACLWGRTAVSELPAAKLVIACPGAVRFAAAPASLTHEHLQPGRHPSRAPPAPSA